MPISCGATCTSSWTTPVSDRCWSSSTTRTSSTTARPTLVHQLAQTGAATVLACVLPPDAPANPAWIPWSCCGRTTARRGSSWAPLDGAGHRGPPPGRAGRPGRHRVAASARRALARRSALPPRAGRRRARQAAPCATRAGSGGYAARCHPTARLVELVTTRLGTLSEAERHALELTALGEPLAQPALDQLADSGRDRARSRTGALIASRMDGRRLQVCLAHPVYGDVVRAGISPRRERVLARAARRGVRRPAPGRHAPPRVAPPRRRRRELRTPPGRGQGGPRTSRLRADRAHGAGRRRQPGRASRRAPGRRGGVQERTARAGRAELAALAQDADRAPVSGSGWPWSAFDHAVLRARHRRHVRPLDALLGTTSIPSGTTSSWPGASASTGCPAVRSRSSTPWNRCPTRAGHRAPACTPSSASA